MTPAEHALVVSSTDKHVAQMIFKLPPTLRFSDFEFPKFTIFIQSKPGPSSISRTQLSIKTSNQNLCKNEFLFTTVFFNPPLSARELLSELSSHRT